MNRVLTFWVGATPSTQAAQEIRGVGVRTSRGV
jgi:hypothetical protein